MNHSISFVSSDTGDNTNTIECTWQHVKAFLESYHRQDYEFHLAQYMFAAKGKAQLMSVHSVPCHRRIYRLVFLCPGRVLRQVSTNCSSPENNGIWLFRYARPIIPDSVIFAMFQAPPTNIAEIPLSRITGTVEVLICVTDYGLSMKCDARRD